MVIAGNPAQCPALTIEDAVQFAIERNERSLAADDRAAAARARVAKARSFFFPTLELRGDYTRRSYETTRVVEGEELTIQSRDALEGRATVEQRIFEARAFPAYRQARLARDAEQYAASDTKRLLAFDAAEAFLATLGAGEVREAAAQRLDLARRSLADARARFDAGLVGSNDVTRASLEAANAEREDVRTRGLLEAALLHLGFLIDEESPDSLETPERLLAEAAARVEDADSLAVAAAALRPDIESDRREAAALHASIEEARLRAIPDLGFTGEYNVTNESGLSGRDNDWSLGLGLTWQLFDGGVRGADRAERTALASAADLGVREGERRADLEVRTALVALTSAQATTDQARVAVEAARRNADETSELYRQGLASALEMVDAGVQLFEAEVDLARTEFGLGLAFLELRSALGLDPLGREVTP